MSIFRKASTLNAATLLTSTQTSSKETNSASTPQRERAGTKAAALIELLSRKEGASLDEMTERTGWLGHTVRAAMTGLRKKGHVIGKHVSGNITVWFIEG
ncbi:MAG: DUF3489 domain-containing protein [Sphingopyxis sp.]|nr:DUF3489 domain-containing protein [Sphingopyxis sp.]